VIRHSYPFTVSRNFFASSGVALPVDPCRFVRAMTDGTRGSDDTDDPVTAMLAARTDTRSGGASPIGQLVMAVETWPVDQGSQK